MVNIFHVYTHIQPECNYICALAAVDASGDANGKRPANRADDRGSEGAERARPGEEEKEEQQIAKAKRTTHHDKLFGQMNGQQSKNVSFLWI